LGKKHQHQQQQPLVSTTVVESDDMFLNFLQKLTVSKMYQGRDRAVFAPSFFFMKHLEFRWKFLFRPASLWFPTNLFVVIQPVMDGGKVKGHQ